MIDRMDAAADITTHPIHLGLGATAEVEPRFTGELDWYEGYEISEFNESDVIAMVVTEGSHLAVVEGQPIAAPPGQVFNYSSGDAMLLSAVLRDTTGMNSRPSSASRIRPCAGCGTSLSASIHATSFPSVLTKEIPSSGA